MRKQIMFMSLLVLFAGCSKEEETKSQENGSIIFKGELVSNISNSTAKYETPECSEEAPVSIRYIMTDSEGSVAIGESSIILEGNEVTSQNGIIVPEGKYTVEDIALLDADGNVVQRMPSKLTTSFDFTNFVTISTPFDIIVLGGVNTPVIGELLCYSVQEVNFDGAIDGTITIKELQTLYMRITDKETTCIDRLEIEVNGKITDQIKIDGPGLYNTPVPAGLFEMVIRAFSGDTQLQSTTMINSYNEDGILDSDDIIKFTDACEGTDPGPAELFDYRDGGIVVWVNPNDSSQGLVCAISDQGKGAPWGCTGTEVMAPDQDPNSLNHNGTSVALGSGEANTSNILFTCSEPGIAASLSADYSIITDGVLYDDWFLPSRDLLSEMYSNKAAIDAAALANGGTVFSDDGYWSSSHVNNDFLNIAWFRNFDDGTSNGGFKSLIFRVRSVRAF